MSPGHLVFGLIVVLLAVFLRKKIPTPRVKIDSCSLLYPLGALAGKEEERA